MIRLETLSLIPFMPFAIEISAHIITMILKDRSGVKNEKIDKARREREKINR